LAKYMTPEATKLIEDYVHEGGVLVCGDPDAFASDLAGKDTTAARERLLGIKTIGPMPRGIRSEAAKERSAAEAPDRIILKAAQWGLPAGTALRLFPLKSADDAVRGCARQIALADPRATVLGTYPDGSPAIVAHALGKGRVITFAANPFAPQVTVDVTNWPAAFKGLQQALGCQVDHPIWHFLLPPP
jgi:hypothetical protein